MGDASETIPSETFRVDFSRLTGEVFGGATGMLYGLSDDDVPSGALIAGARPRTVAQKAPGGAQHPNGDSLEVAAAFFANGGGQLHVYMQDVYSEWPYEQLGIADYLGKVRVMVSAAASHERVDDLLWVPFNEPDWIWYPDWSQDRERFFDDWIAVRECIHSILPNAQIVGPNEMVYNHDRIKDFLAWAQGTNVLPDVVSWHELTPESLVTYREHYAQYRALERELGLAEIPVAINEYGNRRDTSNPAQLIRWMAMFEDTKVDADIAYWTYAGNLDDHAVQTSRANGGWWLLKWYADLTGQTATTVPHDAGGECAQGIAALDLDRAQATVLVGGTSNAVNLELSGLGLLASGSTVDVTISKTSWTGYEGDATQPDVVSSARVPVTDDAAVIPLPGDDPMAAYRVLITPPARPVEVRSRWLTTYEAEDAEIIDAEVFDRTLDPQEHATSGGRDVGAMSQATSRIDFSVEVPRSEDYLVSVFYGTAGAPARQALYLDGEFDRVVSYPATLNPAYRGRADVPLNLAAGPHTISIRTSGRDGWLPESDASIDRIDVSELPAQERSVYPARDARLGTGCSLSPGSATTAAKIVIPESAEATFFLAASDDGYYDLDAVLDGDGEFAIELDGRTVAFSSASAVGSRPLATVHLARGITIARLRTHTGTIRVSEIALSRRSDVTKTVHRGATDLILRGTARLVDDDFADGGKYIAGLDGGSGSIVLPRPPGVGAGRYNLTISYANAAKNTQSHYNTDVISIPLEIVESGGAKVTAVLRHNYAWNNFWQLVVPLELFTDDGDLTFATGSNPALNIDGISLSPLVLTPTHGLSVSGSIVSVMPGRSDELS